MNFVAKENFLGYKKEEGNFAERNYDEIYLNVVSWSI